MTLLSSTNHKLAALALVLPLCGCGTTSTVDVGMPVVDKTDFHFVDKRPLADRASSKQPGIGGEITVLGDDAITPRPADLVRTWLQEKLSQKLTGREVLLTKFHVQVVDPGGVVNDAQVIGADAAVPPAGALLVRPLLAVFEDSRAQKYLTIDIDISVNGVPVTEEYRAAFRGRVTESNLNEALRASLAELSDQVPAS